MFSSEKKRRTEDSPPPDNTMVLYTSMVLIILTFFIMITTKANFDETKYGKAVESVSRTFGFFSGGVSAIGGESGIPVDGPSFRDGVPIVPPQDREMNQIRQLLNPGLIDGDVRIVRNQGQRIISVSSGMVFEGDSVELTPESRELLLAFCRIMRNSDIPVTIEGHTDNLPPATEGVGDNWDISLGRALAVLNLFVEEGGMDLARLSAYGYAGGKPIVANNSQANRAKNNRVDLVLDYDSKVAGSIRALSPKERSFDFQGFEFSLPERPGEEGQVY